MPVIRYGRLPTEQAHPRSRDLDRLPLPRLLRIMSDEDARVVRAVRRAHPQIARAIRLLTAALRRGGRLFFVGAGTSGRLGVIEAAECPPTFSVDPRMIRALIAGGRRAVFRSREGAEDNAAAARRAIRRAARPGDVLVGIAASGVTPFVAGALAAGRRARAATILLTCNPRAALLADVRIRLAVGPELLAGSTRLKAGTATKLVLNMLTLGAMVQLGNTYGNLMVDMHPASRKLRARAVRMIQRLAGASPSQAAAALAHARGRVKLAILLAAQGLSVPMAERCLAQAGGSLREALARPTRRTARQR